MNIIADVAGQYDVLVRLLERMPQERTVFLGDLIDRGPDSRKVVELVRSKHECVLANHEHFMIDWVHRHGWYDDGLWLVNGGRATLASYAAEVFENRATPQMIEDVKWMEKNPLYIETDDLFLSHAPWRRGFTLEEASQVLVQGFGGKPTVTDWSLLWCRDVPQVRDGKIQMFGHNSYWGVIPFHKGIHESASAFDLERDPGVENDPMFFSATTSPVPVEMKNLYALGLDNSWMRRLTGAHFDEETKKITIYQEQFGL